MSLTERLVASRMRIEFHPSSHPLGNDQEAIEYRIYFPDENTARIIGWSTDIVQTLVHEMDRIDAYKKHWNKT